MKILICGLGSIGQRHLKILRKLGCSEISSYRTGKGTKKIDQELEKGITFFNSLEEAISDGPDAALVSNPSSLHVETSIELAKKGISLFIEKPLSHNIEKLDVLKEVVEKNNVKVLIAYNLIFHLAIKKIKELLDSGVAGKIISTTSRFGVYMPDWHPWEDYKTTYAARKELGGGVVLTSSHELNYLTYLFGEVDKVKALKSEINILEMDCEDGVDIIMRHKNKISSNVHLNFYERGYNRYLHIVGEKKCISWKFTDTEVIVHDKLDREVFNLEPNDFIKLLNLSYEDQLKHFLKVVRNEEDSLIPLSKVIADQKLIDKILKDVENE